MGILHQTLDQIDKILHHKSVNPTLTRLEELIKVPRKYTALVLLSMLSVGIFIGCLNQIIVIIGFIYPAYKSIKAIESASPEDDRRWLVYWVVYSTLIILEYFSDLLLFWFPMYYAIKSILLVWIMHPNYNGSEFIYNNIIKPGFIKNEKMIDQLVENVQTSGTGTINKLVGEVGEIGEEVLNSQGVKEKMVELSAEGLKKAAMMASQQDVTGEEKKNEWEVSK